MPVQRGVDWRISFHNQNPTSQPAAGKQEKKVGMDGGELVGRIHFLTDSQAKDTGGQTDG